MKISIKAKITDDMPKVRKRTKAATIKSLSRAGAYIRGIAQRSIKISANRSKAGLIPTSRKGKLGKAIIFKENAELNEVIIGPNFGIIGRVGQTHEFGGVEGIRPSKQRNTKFKLEVGGFGPIRIKGLKLFIARLRTDEQVELSKRIVAELPSITSGKKVATVRRYPARPFMGPALVRAKQRLPQMWANSIKGG
jgi:hypothetical protein